MLLIERIKKRLLADDVMSQSLPGLPIAELAGNQRILIENHVGICQYAKERISIKVNYGILCVYGKELTLQYMTRHQLVICGMIEKVELYREDGKGNGR